ncbi:DNA topoisomerase III, partial [Marinomonas sp.]|nr:DNA topoisomerase III [Marinomonas sp.]
SSLNAMSLGEHSYNQFMHTLENSLSKLLMESKNLSTEALKGLPSQPKRVFNNTSTRKKKPTSGLRKKSPSKKG